MRRLAVTTGDPDGIGLEIASKALRSTGPFSNVQWVIFKSRSGWPSEWSKNIGFKVAVSSFEDLASQAFDAGTILVCEQDSSPADWVMRAADGCVAGFFAGMATGPMSKLVVGGAGGHTGILQKHSKIKIKMGFFGTKMNVVLATDHISLKEVSNHLTQENLKESFLTAHIYGPQILECLIEKNIDQFELLALGLNPHAGEQGLLGDEELSVIEPLIEDLRDGGVAITGPIAPDTLGTRLKNSDSGLMRGQEQIILALYHDQGLIPFKLLHGQDSGFQVSLGLPFMRTSVDHGTAKDIFAKGIANEGSMKEAIVALEKLTRKPERWPNLYETLTTKLSRIRL